MLANKNLKENEIEVKTIDDEDFNNYKVPSMLIGFPHCTFKCDKDCGERMCQNGALDRAPNYIMTVEQVWERYEGNPLTTAFVFGGLEPFDDFVPLKRLVVKIRENCEDDIVIYTGYREEEIIEQLHWLRQFDNIIINPNINSFFFIINEF
jgi:hypothetical protein